MQKRNTIQKLLVLDAVSSLKNHPTADEVYEYVKKNHPSIGKGTIYRDLNSLAEDGKLRKIVSADTAIHFDHTLAEHHHLKCIQCGKIYDLDMDSIPDLIEKVHHSAEISIIGYDIIFSGICSNCLNHSVE